LAIAAMTDMRGRLFDPSLVAHRAAQAATLYVRLRLPEPQMSQDSSRGYRSFNRFQMVLPLRQPVIGVVRPAI
jgi:hypothetical protein